MSEIVVNSKNYEEVINNNDVVLIDFWATWCGPCQMLGPIIEEIADEYDGRVAVCKCDVDEDETLAMQFGINTIPAVFVLKKGKVEEQFIGFRQKLQIETMLNKYI